MDVPSYIGGNIITITSPETNKALFPSKFEAKRILCGPPATSSANPGPSPEPANAAVVLLTSTPPVKRKGNNTDIMDDGLNGLH